jgi:hypothetical protein
MARSAAIKMDFLADMARIAGTRLTEAGYTFDPNDPPEVTLRKYLNVRMRRIKSAKRTTFKAKAFTCPSDHQAGVDLLIKKSEAGDDLRTYQSTSLDNPDFNDAMLQDWNISHFHLGTTPYPRNPSFMDRTDPLLFAFVTSDSLYCIDVMGHGSWSNVQLLDAVYENWPDLLKPFVLHGIKSSATAYKNDEIAKLRKAGLVVATTRPDGTIHGLVGGGYSVNGDSVQVTSQLSDIMRDCRDAQQAVGAYFDDPAQASNSLPAELQLHEDGGELYAIDEFMTYKLKVTACFRRTGSSIKPAAC